MLTSKTIPFGIGLIALVVVSTSVSYINYRRQKGDKFPLPSSITSTKHKAHRFTATVDRNDFTSAAPFVLAGTADIIVLGKVTKTLAVRTTPIDCPAPDAWMGNHTVYAFQVEEYLKGSGSNALKIHNEGGAVGDRDYFQADNPGLIEGERYFLFLKSYEDDPHTKKNGFIPCGVGGKTYKLGDADELFPIHFQRGKIRIENGILVQATDEDHRLSSWRFEGQGSDQLIGITEQEAHDVIRKAIKQGVGLGKSVVYSDAPP